MDGDYAEQEFMGGGHEHDDLDASNNGDEQIHDEEYEQEEQQHGMMIKSFNNVDDGSTGNGINGSVVVDHRRDLSAAGKLFVGGISWETTEETFGNYFSKYGELTDSVIMLDKQSGRPRGFGFVTYVDPAVVDKVLEEEHVIDGRAVEVKRTVPREDMQQPKGVSKTKKIFVGGIPPSFSEDEMKEYFSSYGGIVEHQIMLDHQTGRSRGFGFVTFESEDAVEMIVSQGKTHELGGKQVEIKKAEPKRAWADPSGNGARSYGGSRGSAASSYAGRYNSGGGYSGKEGGYGSYGGYGNYGGGYGGASAGFYNGYGGYGYGFGFGGPMYGNTGYGGSGYGVPGGYGTPGGYAASTGYGDGKGYGSGRGGYGSGGRGRSRDGYGSGGRSYVSGGRGGADAGAGRYHPYER